MIGVVNCYSCWQETEILGLVGNFLHVPMPLVYALCHYQFSSRADFLGPFLHSTGNTDTLGTELLESLLKMAPTKEEERKLKEFKDEDESPFKLGPAERFLRAVLEIPFAFKRVDAMLYIANFDSEVEYLKRSFDTIEVNFHSQQFFFTLAFKICAFMIFYSSKHILCVCSKHSTFPGCCSVHLPCMLTSSIS